MTYRPLKSLIVTSVLFAINLNAIDNTCNYGTPESFGKIESQFYGKWKIEHMKGFVTVGGMTLPYKGNDDMDYIKLTREKAQYIKTDHEDGSSELNRKEGRFIGTHPKMQRPVVFEWASESAWSNKETKNPLNKLTLSDDDVAMTYGCNLNEMPRLIGKTYVIMDGIKMNLTYRLIPLSENSMYAYMHAYGNTQGMQYNSWRSVSLSRIGN